MPDPIERRVRAVASQSVGRGCFFAALAIWCVMVGLIADPLQSIKAGAILAMLTACILLLKAGRAPHVPYKRTEVWLLLNRRLELRPEAAQKVIAAALREIYLRYAFYAALMAVGFWGFALLLWLTPDLWNDGTSHQPIGFATGRQREIEAFKTMP